MTWSPIGAKQIAIVGMDEKRAFMLMVSMAADGTLLPLQAIYMGSTKASLPNPAATNYSDLQQAGFKLEASGTKTYWSNQMTMKSFVNTVLVPHLDKKKMELNLPPSQKSLWQIDV